MASVSRLALVVANVTSAELLPYLALAVALRSSGFTLRLGIPEPLIPLAVAHGFERGDIVGLSGDKEADYQSPKFREAASSASLLSMATVIAPTLKTSLTANLDRIHALVRDVHGCLSSSSVMTECSSICQKHQIPYICLPALPLAPFIPTSFQSEWLNDLSEHLGGFLLWRIVGGIHNTFRTSVLQIGPQPGYIIDGVSQVTAYSSILLGRGAASEPHIHPSSYWKLPEASTYVNIPTPASHPSLCRLLANPSPDVSLRPIFCTFESHPLPQPAAFLRVCHSLASRIGVPIIIQSHPGDWASFVSVAAGPPVLEGVVLEGEGGREVAPVDIKVLVLPPRRVEGGGDACTLPLPYSWLLAKCSLAISHGGAGITQAAMEAGLPAVAFPVFAEDYWWAARISTLGAGPLVHYHLRELPERLDEVVKVCRSPLVMNAARRLGEALRGEGDGVKRAVTRIKEILSKPQQRHCGITCTWAPDSSSETCTVCTTPFTFITRRRHCRSCGRLACGRCLSFRAHLPGYPDNRPEIVCEGCLNARRAFLALHHGQAVVPSGSGGEGGEGVPTAGAGGGSAVGGGRELSSPTPIPPARTAILSDMDEIPLHPPASPTTTNPSILGTSPSPSRKLSTLLTRASIADDSALPSHL